MISNMLTARAVTSGIPLSYNNRQVRHDGGTHTTRVLLHGEQVLAVDWDAHSVTLNGGAYASKKGTGLINAVLEALGTKCRVSSSRRRWTFIDRGSGRMENYTGKDKTINIEKP